jgi:hypothetical protein
MNLSVKVTVWCSSVCAVVYLFLWFASWWMHESEPLLMLAAVLLACMALLAGVLSKALTVVETQRAVIDRQDDLIRDMAVVLGIAEKEVNEDG